MTLPQSAVTPKSGAKLQLFSEPAKYLRAFITSLLLRLLSRQYLKVAVSVTLRPSACAYSALRAISIDDGV